MKTMLWLMVALFPAILGAAEMEESAPTDEGDQKVFGKSEEASYKGKVVIIKVGEEDLVNEQSFKFMRRTLNRIGDEGAKAVVFDLNTPGGLAWQTSELMMNDLGNLKVPTYAFVNSKALSAGALIAVATDEIYMKPMATIGAAAIVNSDGSEMDPIMRAKVESAYDAFVRSVVEEKGHPLDVVRAMMFQQNTYEFGDIKVAEGALLTLTSKQAVEDFGGSPLLAKGIVDSVEELLEKEGLGGVPVVEAEPTGFEKMAWWIKYLSPVLILVGLGAAYAEMKMPGFGVGGAISLAAFALFFFGNYAAGNMAGYELAAVFAVGMLLIALEVFVIPGTGIAGIVGLMMVIGSLLLAMVDSIDFQDYGNDDVTSGPGLIEVIAWPAMSLALGLLGAIVLMMFLMRYLPNTPLLGFLTAKGTLVGGASIDSATARVESRVGWTGETSTDLRPTGKAVFQSETVDVTTQGDFVKKGAKVRIVAEDGMGVVVHEIDGV